MHFCRLVPNRCIVVIKHPSLDTVPGKLIVSNKNLKPRKVEIKEGK